MHQVTQGLLSRPQRSGAYAKRSEVAVSTEASAMLRLARIMTTIFGYRTLVFGLVSALAMGLGACGQGTPEPDPTGSFSRLDYCQAMHSAFPDIDAAAIAEGDEVALEKARDTYARLAGQAPDRLEDNWATIITGLDSLIAQANGSEPVSSQEFTAFRTAYSAIYEDYQEFCVDNPPVSPNPN